ncbi:MAG: hypothetical protein HY245_03955 [Rhizobiales bacterium]|nr:hypothetical protein [Hyphomicrobiales bacterium]MBI3672576.1 hypothetical protein [Hyphomicrobiales bacterium]
MSHPTVAAIREELVAGGKIFHHETVRSRDGQPQPAKKSPPPTLASATLPGIEPEGTAADILARAKDIRTERADRNLATVLDRQG